jgi:hypothetical protein
VNLLELARAALPTPPAKRSATRREADELRALIEHVLADAPTEWGWVHQVACADPEAALMCWRSLAADRGLVRHSVPMSTGVMQ